MAAGAVPEAKSPPRYPDLCGKRRLQLELQMLNREMGFLQEELQSLEGLQSVSRCCKEINEFVGTNPDPLIPINKRHHQSYCIFKWLWKRFCLCLSWTCCCGGCTSVLEPENCICACPDNCCKCNLGCPQPSYCCRTCTFPCCSNSSTCYNSCCSCPSISCCKPRCSQSSCCRPRCPKCSGLCCCCNLFCCMPRKISCPEFSCGCVWSCPECTGACHCPKCSRPCCTSGCLC